MRADAANACKLVVLNPAKSSHWHVLKNPFLRRRGLRST